MSALGFRTPVRPCSMSPGNSLLIEAWLARIEKSAFAAGDVIWDEHVVALLQLRYLAAVLLDDPGEFVAEGHPDASVGNGTVIEVEIRSADAGARHPDNRVTWVQYRRHGFAADADPERVAVVHC